MPALLIIVIVFILIFHKYGFKLLNLFLKQNKLRFISNLTKLILFYEEYTVIFMCNLLN